MKKLSKAISEGLTDTPRKTIEIHIINKIIPKIKSLGKDLQSHDVFLNVEKNFVYNTRQMEATTALSVTINSDGLKRLGKDGPKAIIDFYKSIEKLVTKDNARISFGFGTSEESRPIKKIEEFTKFVGHSKVKVLFFIDYEDAVKKLEAKNK